MSIDIQTEPLALKFIPVRGRKHGKIRSTVRTGHVEIYPREGTETSDEPVAGFTTLC